ncbi:hypothetical protein IFM89_017765 [Coptis chinensis]|uniref:Endonuclease/exonuclease/phosphatase n=1 Tax=Coptis chinensis TaxID=261450 RepID=A0A835M3Q6_9MAGN|nr:hypothetical protein IFM89_017765 [Coptis chinensis]
MRILAWNCRGVGLDFDNSVLKRSYRVERPSIIFLCETKADVNKSSADFMRSFASDYKSFVIGSRGLSGDYGVYGNMNLMYKFPIPNPARSRWHSMQNLIPANTDYLGYALETSMMYPAKRKSEEDLGSIVLI